MRRHFWHTLHQLVKRTQRHMPTIHGVLQILPRTDGLIQNGPSITGTEGRVLLQWSGALEAQLNSSYPQTLPFIPLFSKSLSAFVHNRFNSTRFSVMLMASMKLPDIVTYNLPWDFESKFAMCRYIGPWLLLYAQSIPDSMIKNLIVKVLTFQKDMQLGWRRLTLKSEKLAACMIHNHESMQARIIWWWCDCQK